MPDHVLKRLNFGASQTGAQYDGEMRDGKRNGKGTQTYSDGTVYEGHWKNDRRHGNGILRKDGKVQYDGQWKDNVRHGEGTQHYENGTVYVGDWKNDQLNGNGTLRKGDQVQYDGQWKDNVRHGKGTQHYNNGTYVGHWKNGQRHGNGIFRKGGEVDFVEYDGEWENDARNGEGKSFTNGYLEYDGQWENNQKKSGTLFYTNGATKYVGTFKNDLYHGHGAYENHAQKYVGDFANGKFHGSGTFTQYGVKVRDGQWKNGKCISGKLYFHLGAPESRIQTPAEMKQDKGEIINATTGDSVYNLGSLKREWRDALVQYFSTDMRPNTRTRMILSNPIYDEEVFYIAPIEDLYQTSPYMYHTETIRKFREYEQKTQPTFEESCTNKNVPKDYLVAIEHALTVPPEDSMLTAKQISEYKTKIKQVLGQHPIPIIGEIALQAIQELEQPHKTLKRRDKKERQRQRREAEKVEVAKKVEEMANLVVERVLETIVKKELGESTEQVDAEQKVDEMLDQALQKFVETELSKLTEKVEGEMADLVVERVLETIVEEERRDLIERVVAEQFYLIQGQVQGKEQMRTELEKTMQCPITAEDEFIEDPVVAEDGHTYERSAIQLWFQTKKTSPKTGLEIGTNLIPNHMYKQIKDTILTRVPIGTQLVSVEMEGIEET